jgi:glucose-6-phosphate-specific signal transduction histidine kinase
MSRSTSRARQDLVIVAILTVGFALLSVKLDLSERLFQWTHAREWIQLDELPQILLVFAGLLSWFALRRKIELTAELARRDRAEKQLAAALADNRRLGHQAVDVQESERRALAREMHDELGQYLVAIRLDATSIRDGLDATAENASDVAATIVRHIDHVQAVVRDIIGRLRPAGLDELGLAAALENCVESWRRRLPGVDIRLLIEGDVDGFGEDVSLALYRLTQESLVNVSRHAAADQMQIVLLEERGPDGVRKVHFSAEDDGHGATLPPRGRGFGLSGMRERVQSLGGVFQVDSQPGTGFRVRATVLCSPERVAREAESDAT